MPLGTGYCSRQGVVVAASGCFREAQQSSLPFRAVGDLSEKSWRSDDEYPSLDVPDGHVKLYRVLSLASAVSAKGRLNGLSVRHFACDRDKREI